MEKVKENSLSLSNQTIQNDTCEFSAVRFFQATNKTVQNTGAILWANPMQLVYRSDRQMSPSATLLARPIFTSSPFEAIPHKHPKKKKKATRVSTILGSCYLMASNWKVEPCNCIINFPPQSSSETLGGCHVTPCVGPRQQRTSIIPGSLVRTACL